MAEAAVISALQKLTDVSVKKALELYEVSDQIEPMQRDLRFIQAFLKDVDSKQQKNASVKEWVNQVRELGYRIECVMDTFLVEIEENPSNSTFEKPAGNNYCSCFRKLRTVTKHPFKLNTLSSDLKEINAEMKRIFEIRTQLDVRDLGTGSAEPVQVQLPFRPTKPFHVDDLEVVGFDSDKSKIISHLLDKNISRRTVLSIVGVGGLGKTTLAQKVYKSAELDAEFPCRAWVSISQKFNENNICRQILYAIEPTMKQENPSDKDIWEALANSLSTKRYLIILDDVWTVELWERLKISLPDSKSASRVIITTRNLDVAKAADRNMKQYKLDYLSKDDSLVLLFRKALQQHGIQPDNYPSHLVKVAEKLMEKCGRLPLALVVLGSMLSTKPETSTAWTKVYDTLDWHNDYGKKCMQILRLSFQELCYEQKQRFLYFAAFPEDHNISVQHITRMWIAEGLIAEDGVGTLEDRADDYLEDLVKRFLVQVVEKSWNGNYKYCHMHDLVRDLTIHEAKEENFFTVFSKHKDGNQLATKEAHRVALQFHTPRGFDTRSTNIISLLCFGQYVSNYQGFSRLKVLVIEGIDMSTVKVSKNWLEGLVHLRYLGFRYCYEMPKGFENVSFRTMKNLETFDCKETGVVINHSIWEVPSLRHVIISPSPIDIPCTLKWNGLRNIQTLKWVALLDIPKLECCVNLHTLKIYDFDLERCESAEEGWQKLKAVLSQTAHLVSLALILYESYLPFLTVGTRELPCHEKIQSLWLSGKWAKNVCVSSVEMFPINLTKLKLELSELEKDPMPILEKLQCLRILLLGRCSFVGTKLICTTGGFPSLKKLKLEYLPNLSQWEIKEGAMPILNSLEITSCDELLVFPDLKNKPNLQQLQVFYSDDELGKRIQLEYLNKFEHIPFVYIA